MNVRFADRALRCRITGGELDRLLGGRAIALAVALPRNHTFRITINPAAIGGWVLDSDPTGMWLSIPRADLEALAQSQPSRTGIGQAFPTGDGEVQVRVEVDVRERSE